MTYNSGKNKEASSNEDASRFLAEREGFEPSCALAQTDFEKYNGRHNPSLCVPNFRKIRRFFRFSSAHLSDFSEK